MCVYVPDTSGIAPELFLFMGYYVLRWYISFTVWGAECVVAQVAP